MRLADIESDSHAEQMSSHGEHVKPEISSLNLISAAAS